MLHIGFSGEISGKRVEELLEVLQRNLGPKLVSIDSPGGTFEFFSRLAPALSRAKFTSLGLDVRSAAVVLQLLGHRRLATPDSVYFFHEVRAIVDGREILVCDVDEFMDREREHGRLTGERKEALEEWRRSMDAAQRWMLSFMQERTGLSQELFRRLMQNEVTLSAQEAKRYGIVHEIVPYEALPFIERNL